MKQVLKYVLYFSVLALAGYFLWRFAFLMGWILMAAVLTFICSPIMNFFLKLRYKKIKMPRALASVFTIIALFIVSLSFIAIFVPLIMEETRTIAQIDVKQLSESLQAPLAGINEKAQQFNLIPAGISVQEFVLTKVKAVFTSSNLTDTINKLFGVVGSVFIGFGSIVFITFFFLKDENLFEKMILGVVPEKFHEKTQNVMNDSQKFLKRYFVGVMLELLGDMALITIGLWIFGIKNPLLIGFIGGLMNIIPYIGPLIGMGIGLLLAITSTLAMGSYDILLPVILKVVGVFTVANFIDNNVLQPMIFSNSIKAHPLEIFFAIIIGGTLAGALGMLVAIPVYTVLRVIAREFFQQFRAVRSLTERKN